MPAERFGSINQDNHLIAFLDINPITDGNTLIVPKAHAVGLADLPPEVAQLMLPVAQRIAEALNRSEPAPGGINLMLADGVTAGQEVFHAHLHVLARYWDDGFGFKLPDGQPRFPNRQELDQTTAQLQRNLASR